VVKTSERRFISFSMRATQSATPSGVGKAGKQWAGTTRSKASIAATPRIVRRAAGNDIRLDGLSCFTSAGATDAGSRYLPSIRVVPAHCLPALPTPTG